MSTPTIHKLSALPLSAPEITNSGRGQNHWLGQPSTPASWPLVDVYRRPDGAWRTIEHRPGQYDWTILDRALAEAKARGGRLTWRTMPWYSPESSQAEAPAWIPTRTVVPKDGSPSFTCPDWDHPAYIQSWINLVRAMGVHADKDLRLWAVDLSGFGAWGEHYWQDDNWGPRMSVATFDAISVATRAAFPNTWVLGPAMDPGMASLPKAYRAGGKWGTRYDWLGGQELSYEVLDDYRDLWKTGPVVTEWGNSSGVTMERGLRNIETMHASVLSSGNLPAPYSSMSAADRATFDAANKRAGFRISLDKVERPSTWLARQAGTITTTWTNHGVAPTYDEWQIQFLVDGQVVPLPGDLRTLLPGTQTFTGRVTLPVKRGTLAIRVVDRAGYLPPMRLANQGRLADGSYPLV